MPVPTTSTVERPKSLGYGARLNDVWFRLATGPNREFTVETAPLQAPKISTAENPEDISDEFGELFSRVDFTGGEGLDVAHRRDAEPVDATRYWDSTGISVRDEDPSKMNRARLLHVTELVESSADSNLYLAHDGESLFMAEGTTVRRCDDPAATPPSFVDDNPHAGEGAVAVKGLASLGSAVFAALGANGVHKRPRATGTWAHFSAFAALRVWEAKDILFASSGAVLAQLDAAGLATTVVTLPTDDSWTCVADAGAAILASATNGYVYALADSETPGVLEVKGQTYVGPDVPQVVQAGHGQVFYATRQATGDGANGKWWRAELSPTAFVLTASTLIRQWAHPVPDDPRDHAPLAMIASRNGVYVGVQEDQGSFLWRYDQGTTARSRDLDAHTAGLIVDIADVGDQMFFSVAGHGLRRESRTAYEPSGYLIGPLGDLFTASEKAWVGAVLDHEALPAGTSVELAYTTEPDALTDPDSPLWTIVKTVHGGIDTSETPIPTAAGRYIAGRVRWYASNDQASTPAVRGFSFRAYPGGGEWLVKLPLSVADTIEIPGRRRLRTRTLGGRIYDRLRDLPGRYVELELLYPTSQVFRGIVEQVSEPTPAISRRGTSTVVAFVQFRGRRVPGPPQLSALADSPTLGLGAVGITTTGGVAT